ncbi:MAG: hypothetical protein WCL54_02340 [Clostridia bacterium]
MSQNNNTRKLTLAGILLAIATICCYLATWFPTSKMALIAVASFVSGVIILETGLRLGAAFTLASVATAFLVMMGQPIFIIYATLFAPYGLVRAIIEKNKNKYLQIILKLIYFNIVFFLFLNLFETIVFNFDAIKKLIGMNDIDLLLFIGGSVVFLIYDYAFTLAMRFYKERIAKFVNKGEEK